MNRANARASGPGQGAAGAVLMRRPQVKDVGRIASALNNGPMMAAQRKQLQGLFGKAAQLAGSSEKMPEEDILKSRFAASRKAAPEDESSRS